MRERVREAVEARDANELVALFDPMPLSAAMRQLFALDADERDILLALIPVELAARLIEEAPHSAAAELIDRMDPGRAADVMEELDTAMQADLIGDMDDEDAEAILAEFHPEDAADVRRLAEYEDDTAGGLMIADMFSFRDTQTVAAILRDFAREDADLEAYGSGHPYIVDKENRPVGVVSLRALLLSKRTDRLSKIMVSPVMTVPVSMPLFDLQDLFDRHSFLGFPVVEADGTLVGVVSRQAVHDAALERSESESLRRHGVVGDELRSMPFFLRSRRRLAWLSANIVLNIIAASVISAYEDILTAVIAIAIFLPMVSDMSGCSGNQAVGVTMRELSLGLVQPRDAFRVWLKEVSVGAANGLMLGIMIGTVAWAWKGNPWLGVVIGLALAINTVVAVSIGGVIPLLLKRLKQDPAAASSPLLTTITDMAGFFLVLSLASLMMPLLV
ncbi:MAG: magnesium transporter [Rhodobacteraceae bacterium]|nr:magnesium transporter [Paracoccaceae bacterium]